MDDNLGAALAIGLSVVVFGLLITGVVLVVRDTIRKKGNWGINLSPPACRSCGEPAPVIRKPANMRQTLWGGWTCPQCGLELDKWGEPVTDQPFPAKWSAQLDDRDEPQRRPMREPGRNLTTSDVEVISVIDPVIRDTMTRRELMGRVGMGMASLGLAGMIAGDGTAAPLDAGRSGSPLAPRPPHFPGKVKRVVHLFMNGGPSHVDTFDPKPSLEKWAGKPVPNNLRTERKTGAAFPSPYKFSNHGKSGLPISDIFPHVAKHADKLCVIRSMHADVPNHEPSLLLMNCGEARLPRPSMGSWVTYGLGSENQNLPGFIAMCPGGYPIQETQNWQSAFLPGVYQGTYIDTRHTDLDKLIENIRNTSLPLAEQRRQLDLLRQLNEKHQKKRQRDARLEARIQSFELAYRMQMEASDAFDISREPLKVRERYGPGVHARQLLITRRLLEKGVRFVQVWHGEGQPWDNHDDLAVNHRRLAQQCDQGIGALISDLEQRGMLEDTLIIWGGEFGRTPTVELPQAGANAGKVNGRDHNHWGFSMWLCGGGVKGGLAYGATDEFGFAAVEKKVHVHDLQATIMHLLGFDHEKLTYRYAGRDFRLTDVHGSVVKDLLA